MNYSFAAVLLLASSVALAQPDPNEVLATSINLAGRDFVPNQLPKPLAVRSELGLATFPWVQGQVVHRARNPKAGLFEVRATVTPNGDFLMMFPDGAHYGGSTTKANDMLAYRSTDRGKTWQGPTIAFDIDYNQHGFIPLIPKGSKRLYAFGTQPMFGAYSRENGQQENAPIGFRTSDDDGRTWSEVHLIKPKNDPTFLGMSVMRMTETDRGTWLLGTHEGDWSYKPLMTRLYLLRSEDQGKTWELLPGKRHGGWFARCFNRMDEGRPIALGDSRAFMMARTAEGHLHGLWSDDDGKTWTPPTPLSLVQPDAPPMLFHLSDGKTLIAFHHNRHSDPGNAALDGRNKKMMMDRSEIWFATSTDGGRTWSEPRFVFVNALGETFENPFRNYNCSYLDALIDQGKIHLFMPHRWVRVVHLTFNESDLTKFPTKGELIK